MTDQPLGKLFTSGVQRKAKVRPAPAITPEADARPERVITDPASTPDSGDERSRSTKPAKATTSSPALPAPAAPKRKPRSATQPVDSPSGTSSTATRRISEPTSGTVRGNRVLVVAYLPEALKDALIKTSDRDSLSVGGVLLRAVSRNRGRLSELFAQEGGDTDDLFDSADYSLAPRELDAGPKVRSNFSLLPQHLAKIDELRREHDAPNFSRFVNVVLAEDLQPPTNDESGI